MRILVVDDEELMRRYLRDLLTLGGDEVMDAENGLEALSILEKHEFDVLISDICMPHISGIDLLKKAVELPEPPAVILLTGFGNLETAIEAIQAGAYDYMLKPVDSVSLRNRISQIRHMRDMEREMRRSREHNVRLARMAAVGQLAAGVSHEVNNPVTFLRGNSQLLEAYLKRLRVVLEAGDETALREEAWRICAEIPEILGGIEQGTERIRKITSGLARFANAQNAEQPGETCVNKCIEDALALLSENECGVALELRLDDSLPLMSLYRRELTQALACVISNAYYAVARISAPRVRITSLLREGQVVVKVEDSGTGVPDKYKDRIFDPFFSTREVNQGVGLGLFVAHGVVHNDHGGRIFLEKSDLGGACFIIEFPLQKSFCPDSGNASSATKLSRLQSGGVPA
jgi:signal transduction histidine kinase